MFKNIKLDIFFSYISIFLFSLVIFYKCYLVAFSNSVFFPIVILFFSFMFLVLSFFYQKKFKKNSLFFLLILLIMFLPILFNNVYIIANNYSNFIFYILSFLYAGIFYLKGFKKNEVDFIFRLFIIFSLITSIVTWIADFWPNVYLNSFLPLLPSGVQIEVKQLFLYENANPGLTDHYSRNAFFMLLGLLGSIYFFKSNRKVSLSCILFLSFSLLLVGKRGHILFFALSLIISYFIYYKVSFKLFFKFLLLLFLIFSVFLLISNIFPSINTFYYRMTNFNHNDISNGRFDLYSSAIYMYKENGYSPIGWGGFTKNMNFSFAGVHNDYLQLFVETGIIGFLFVVLSNFLILFKSIFLVRRNHSSFTFVLMVYNLFFLLYSFTGIPHYDFEVYFIYLIFSSIIYYMFEGSCVYEKDIK